MADPKDPNKPAAPWDANANAPRRPAPTHPGRTPQAPEKVAPTAGRRPAAPGDRLSTADGPQSTLFVGGPAKPKQEESEILMMDSAKPTLAVTGGPGKGKEWALQIDKFFIGREAPCNAIVDDPACSRRHAQIYKKNARWFLRDLDSTNGTYLDGPLRGTERILWDGDVFRIGDWEFTFTDPQSVRK